MWILPLVLRLVVAGPVQPQTPPDLPLRLLSYEEPPVAEPPVADETGVLVGFVAGEDTYVRDRSNLWLRLPAEPMPKLCLLVRSRDGYLNATAVFDATRAAGRFVRLGLPYRQRREFARRPGQQITALALYGAGCEDHEAMVVPVSWTRHVAGPMAALYLNSNTDPDLVWRPMSRVGTAADCRVVAGGRGGAAYGRRCSVERAATTTARRLEIRICRDNCADPWIYSPRVW